MKKYFLIARNKKTNQFQILKINDEWYLGKDKATGVKSRDNNLEVIDLVTSNFNSREELATRLFANGYIDDSNVDIFIASKNKRDGQSYIKFDEVIYGEGSLRRKAALQTIARNSLEGNVSKDKSSTGIIYDYVISASYSSDDFLEMVSAGETNISNKFSEKLLIVPRFQEMPLDLKFDKSFRIGSYNEFRNIIEALNRLERFGYSHRNDRVSLNRDFIEENYADRMALVPRLALELENNYCDGQLSLFGYFDENNGERIKTATKMVAQETKSQENKRADYTQIQVKNMSVEQMQKEIFRVLDILPSNVFKYKDESWVFNENIFSFPILSSEKLQLDNLLTGNMPKFFKNYALHKEQKQSAENQGDFGEAAILHESCEMDKMAIKKRFRSGKCIVDTYNWCMLYEGCMKRDNGYSEENGVGEGQKADAKIFGKKK